MGPDAGSRGISAGVPGVSASLHGVQDVLCIGAFFHGRGEADLFLCPEPDLPEEYACRVGPHDGIRRTDRVSARLPHREDKSVREDLVQDSLCHDLHGAALRRRDGLAETFKPDGRHAECVPEKSVRPVRGSVQHLFDRRPRMGADDILLSVRVYHHFPRDGKDGSLA